MQLKTKVKINGINNLSDARYGAGMGVDMMGICVEKDKQNYIAPDRFKEIAGWVSGPLFVAECSNLSGSDIKACLSNYELDAVQIETEEQIREISDLNLRPEKIIFKLFLDDFSLEGLIACLEKNKSAVDLFLMDSHQDIMTPHSLEIIKTLSGRFPVLLSFGLKEDNVERLILDTQIQGIALDGGQEIQPGLKDFDGMADILEAIFIDE